METGRASVPLISMSKYRGFTEHEQAKGREKAIANRSEKAKARRVQVAVMRAEGKSKAEIARHFGVNWETINRDCKVIEAESDNAC